MICGQTNEIVLTNKINIMKKSTTLICFLILAAHSFGQDVVNNKFGKGIYNAVAKDSSYSVNFAMRFQSLFIGEWLVNDSTGIGDAETNFLIRRSRLKFSGFAYSPKLQYKLELGLSNRDVSGASSHTSSSPNIIFDAIIKWNFYKNVTLIAGQTKLPGNRERVVSSSNLQLVDRSLLNSYFNIDRDMGAMLSHEFKIGEKFMINETFALSQGEGRNVTAGNKGGLQYTGRIELLPLGEFAKSGDYIGGDLSREKTPKLSIGATYDLNQNAVKTRSNLGSYMVNDMGFFETDIQTIFVDGMFKYKGFSLMWEYADRTAERDSAMNSDGTPTGAVVDVGSAVNAQAGYLFKNNLEIAGRYTSIMFDKSINGKEPLTQYTLGVSRYIVGHKLKVQTDVSYLMEENSSDSELMYRIQFEVHF